MKIIISGGGTAGHINPALAVAGLLREAGHEILFVGAQGKMEMERVPAAGFEIVGLPVVGFQRRITLGNLLAPFKLLKSYSLAGKIIDRFSPDVVVGFGGYASAPIVMAAQRRGVRTVLQEQNSFAGLTNRKLARRADKICVAYDGMESYFPADKIVLTGNPLRNFFASMPSREEAMARLGLDPSRRTILVVGGSLGTRTLNEAVIAATLPPDIQLIWQCGKFYCDEMLRRAPEKHPRPFIERMDDAYSAADVVVTRSGALTVSELQLVGKATIFVPSPNVAGDHQTFNAMSLVNRGAALLVPDSEAVATVFAIACDLLNDSDKMNQMADAQRAMGRPDAAAAVAQIVVG